MPEVFPDRRFLPLEARRLHWYEIDDVTAVAAGNQVFDPRGAVYGVIETITTNDDGTRRFAVRWHKTEGDNYLWSDNDEAMLKYWWADPVLQEVN